MPTDAEEQVRASGATRRSDPAERVALFDLLPGLDLDLGEVEVHADEAVAVVDEHSVAFEEHILGDHYRPVGDGQDRRTHWRGVVGPSVGLRSRLAVEDALRTEGLALGQRVGRRPKWQREPRRSLLATPDLAQQDSVARVTLEVLRRGVGLRDIGKVDRLSPVITGHHRDVS